MTLAVFEKTLKSLLMTEDGRQAIQSSDAFDAFLSAQGLSEQEQADFKRQPYSRIEQYQYMVTANAQDNLSAMMPIVAELLGCDTWNPLVARFLEAHPPSSYRLLSMGECFVDYLSQQHTLLSDRPYLADLAFYEWTEADLLGADTDHIHQGQPHVPTTLAELTQWAPVINPIASLLNLNYDIAAIIDWFNANSTALTHLPKPLIQETPSIFWVYRTPSPFHCRFFKTDALLGYWLQQLLEDPTQLVSYKESLAPIVAAVQQSQPQLDLAHIQTQFLQALPNLLEKEILAGSAPI